MKRFLKVLIITASVLIMMLGGHLVYLTSLSASEKYPQESYLATEENKTALIIVAHDDDMVGSSGTIAMLCKAGWNVREMCFYQVAGLRAKENKLRNPLRKKSLQQVAKIQGMLAADPVDFNFRNDMETVDSYMPMPYAKFKENYKIDSLDTYISTYIKKYKPSIIFTLDNVIGGYGHPDHVLVSQRIIAYCGKHKNDSSFTIKKIYQPVFPPSLAKKVLGKRPVYIAAKEVYQCSGMPLPDVEINIYPYADLKKESMLAYTTEQNSLKQFWPYYNWYPAWIYFKIFDRDFFKVIEVKSLGNHPD